MKIKQSRILKAIYTTLAIGALFLVLLLLSTHKPKIITVNDQQIYKILVDNKEIPVTIADTPYLRELGLSYTASLKAGTGKLFIFDKPQIQSFWMKDMNYPIDIIWIADDLKIVGITENISPDTYPKTFQSPSEVRYVLEINASESEFYRLIVGKYIQLPKDF